MPRLAKGMRPKSYAKHRKADLLPETTFMSPMLRRAFVSDLASGFCCARSTSERQYGWASDGLQQQYRDLGVSENRGP